jgi:hypothetical protein
VVLDLQYAAVLVILVEPVVSRGVWDLQYVVILVEPVVSWDVMDLMNVVHRASMDVVYYILHHTIVHDIPRHMGDI